MAKKELTIEKIKADAQASIRSGGNIRERVRDLTLRSLKHRPLEPGQIRQVIRAMTEGIVEGAPKTADVRHTLSEAFRGLDQALTKSAEAGSLALQEIASTGKQLGETTLKQGLADLKRLEEDFLATVSDVAEAAESKVKASLRDLVTHARRTGTDTGAKVAETVGALSASMGSLMVDSAKFGMQAAREAGGRFAELASGILSGMADALADDTASKSKSKKRTGKGGKRE
jgi:hypothetical protein